MYNCGQNHSDQSANTQIEHSDQSANMCTTQINLALGPFGKPRNIIEKTMETKIKETNKETNRETNKEKVKTQLRTFA